MIISDHELAKRLGKTIIIDPYNPSHTSSSSHDLTLGEFYYRENKLEREVYDIFSEKHTLEVWGTPQRAIPSGEINRLTDAYRENILPGDKVIMIGPGETILAHTNEFVGGRGNITTMMKARSSYGRVFIEVVKCLPCDTLIRMESGLTKRIDEISLNDKIINVDRHGKSRISCVKSINKSNIHKKTITITTNSNRSCTVSTDHMLMVSRIDGIHIIEAKDLKNTDYLPVISKINIEDDNISNRNDEAELLGYFCAEGHWRKYAISFAKVVEKEEQRSRIKYLMNKIFPNWNPVEYSQQIVYTGVKECDLFKSLYPEVCKLAPEKRVPSFIMASRSTEEIKLFMNAYLICDGYNRQGKNEIQTVSRSKKLIFDIAFLAGRMGAVARFNERLSGAANNLHYYGLYYGNDAKLLSNKTISNDIQHSWNIQIPNLMYTIKDKYKLTRNDMSGIAVTDEKKVSKIRLQNMKFIPEEVLIYVNDLVWEPLKLVQYNEILRDDLYDISLDVEGEQDSLFALENGLMILNCAGWGDVGYINRWTMEITNNSRYYHIPLIVGRRICQIIFFETHKVDKPYIGKYQESDNVQDLRDSWTPDQMLPKLWRDRTS